MFGGFGSTSSTSPFGGNMFGGSTNNAAATAATSVFGHAAQQQPAFGASSAFQQPQNNSTSMFGLWGGQTGTGATGGGSIFGQQPNPTGGGGMFGSSGFPNQNQGTSVPFKPTTADDIVTSSGTSRTIKTTAQCITRMKEYESKSLEELRLEDYQANRKGPQNMSSTSLFGGGTTSTMPTAVPQQTAGASLFSGFGGGANANTSTTSTSGATSFAQPTGLFTSLFNQQKPAGVFGQPQTVVANPAASFWNKPTVQTPSFPNTTTTQSQGFSIFNNATANNAITSTPAPAFGTATTTTSSPFAFGGQQQTTSVFGQQPTGQTNTATPAFGSLFGNTSTNTGVGNAAKKTTFAFGSTALGTQSATAQVAAPPTNAQQPNSGFTFTPPATMSTGFGNVGGTNVSNSFWGNTPTTGTGVGNTTQQPANAFSGGTLNAQQQAFTPQPQFNAFPGGFGIGITSPYSMAVAPSPPSVMFATTPFRDNPLFYFNSSERVEKMSKPTNPLAQEKYLTGRAHGRRNTYGISISSSSKGPGGVKNITYLNTSSKPTSLTKFRIFDGFEEEEHTIGVDVLSPCTTKSNVKRLNLELNIPLGSKTLNDGNSAKDSAKDVDGAGTDKLPQKLNTLNLNSANGRRLRKIGMSLVSSRVDTADSGKETDKNKSELEKRKNEEGVQVEVGAGDAGTYFRNEFLSSEPGSVCGVVNTRPGYFMKPSLEEMDRMVDPRGHCIVTGLEIGRHNFGKLIFLVPVNVKDLNIDEIVFFRHKEVVVYPNDNNKPSFGEGLNCPAEIHLERVWPIDKITNDPIRSPSKVKELNYEGKLHRSCVRQQADFVSYNEEEGIWKFRVSHFSKYACPPEDPQSLT